MLCVSVITGFLFASASSWAVAIPCHNKDLKWILDVRASKGAMVT